jgi:hypothetical protein
MLECFGIFDEDTEPGAAADPDHDRHRRCQPQCAGTGDDQHGDRRHQPIGEARLGTPDAPGDERDGRDRDDHGHKPARHLIGHALDRRASAAPQRPSGRCVRAWYRGRPCRRRSPAHRSG